MGRHYPRDPSPLEITEWLFSQPPCWSRGLIVNMPPAGMPFHDRLFQARMWREIAMAIRYDRPTSTGVAGISKLAHSCGDSLRRARVNLYLARRMRR